MDMSAFSVALVPWGKEIADHEEIVAAAKHAEALGFRSVAIPIIFRAPDTMAVFDHFGNENILDSFVLFPLVAQATKTIRIAVQSMVLPLLPPYFWAKYFASLDVISGGRVDAGMALGFSQRQFDAMGETVKKRGRMSDEQVEVIVRLWTEERVTHSGDFYALDDVTMEPKPVQKPHPPIWWGGGQASIARSAKWADYILAPCVTPREVETEYLPRMKAECEKWGTDTKMASWTFATIDPDKSFSDDDVRDWISDTMRFEDADPDQIGATVAGSPQQCADKIAALHEAGVTDFVFTFQREGMDSIAEARRQQELFAEKVAPLLR